MLSGRLLLDEFLMKVYYSGIIPQGRILDVGTGFNTTILEIFSDKYDIVISDLQPENYNLEGMVKLDVLDWGSSNLAGELFSGIVLSEVLEHIENPQLAISECRKHLIHNGILVGTTPFFYRIHDSDPSDTEVVEKELHDYWRFTPKCIRMMLSNAGFGVNYVTGLPPVTSTERAPQGVGFWGRNTNIICRLDQWFVMLPSNWRNIQEEKAARFAEIGGQHAVQTCTEKEG